MEKLISVILIFFTSCVASFLGSLQLGPVNLFVIDSVLYKNKRSAFFVALGGSIPEFMYCGLAVYANQFLFKSAVFQITFQIAFIIILLFIGCLFWFKRPGVITIKDTSSNAKTSATKNFIKGFSLAALNPQLLPFWMFVHVYFNSVKLLQTQSTAKNFSFILGSGFGAFFFLTLLLVIIDKYKLSILNYINNRYYFKILAILFFAIAIQQSVSLIRNN